MTLRKALHGLGLRYRVDCSPVKGERLRPDIVFSKVRVAVYVDGCFWHSCPLHGSAPLANREWWIQKFRYNAARDEKANATLAAAGWRVVRIWEHEDTEAAVQRILHALEITNAPALV